MIALYRKKVFSTRACRSTPSPCTELPCNGTQALKIPIDDELSYYLEYRKPLGDWDGGIGANGVLVHVAPDYDNYYALGDDAGPYILDMNSGSGMFMHAGDSYDTIDIPAGDDNARVDGYFFLREPAQVVSFQNRYRRRKIRYLPDWLGETDSRPRPP